MGEPARKLAFQKSTGSWVIVAPAGDGYEVAETLDPEDASNWTGEAYDLASAHPKASAELKPKLDWYRDNMINEPTGPLDANGKTTATQQPANDNASAAPANDNDAPTVRPSPVAEDDKPSSHWEALARSGKSLMSNLSNAIDSELPAAVEDLPGYQRRSGRAFDAPLEQEPADAFDSATSWLDADDAEDIGRGLAQGATFRWGDELAANVEATDALRYAPDDIPGAQRTTRRGFDAPLMNDDQRWQAMHDETLANSRAENERSQERSPWLYGISEGVGATPATIAGSAALAKAVPALAVSGPAAQAVPWASLATRSAVHGVAPGFVAGAGGGTEGNRLSSGAIGAGTGAAGGFAGSAIGSGIGATARWAGGKVDDAITAAKDSAPVRATSEYAGNLANRARVAATGAYGGQLKQLSKNEGFEYLDNDFGESIERMFPPEPGVMGIPKARSPRSYAEIARPKQEELGEQIGATLRQLDDQGVSAPVLRDPSGKERAVIDTLDDELAQVRDPMNIGDDDDVMRGALERLHGKTLKLADPAAERSLGTGLPRLQATELAKMKRSLEKSGYATEATKGLPAGVQREANRIAATGPREALRAAVRTQASPETAQRFTALNRDYPVAKTVAELAEGRSAQEQGNQILSLPAAIGALAGGQPGVAAGMVWEVGKRYGADAGANALRGVQRATQLQHGPAAAPSPAFQQATQTAGARAGVPWGSLVRQGQPAMAQGPRVEIGEAQITSSPQQRAETSMGHNLQRDVQNALRAYPQALGPFKEQLKAVEQDPTALSAAINDLMNDPKFRDGVVPQLQAVKGGNR